MVDGGWWVGKGGETKTGWRLGERAVKGGQHVWPQAREKGIGLAGDMEVSGGGGVSWVKSGDWH